MQIHDQRGSSMYFVFCGRCLFWDLWFICLWRILQCVSKHERSISYRLRALYFQKNSPKSTPNIHYSTVPRGNNRLLPLTVPYRTCVKKKQLYKAVDSTASSSFGSIADPFDSLDSDLIIWERLSRKVIFKLVFLIWRTWFWHGAAKSFIWRTSFASRYLISNIKTVVSFYFVIMSKNVHRSLGWDSIPFYSKWNKRHGIGDEYQNSCTYWWYCLPLWHKSSFYFVIMSKNVHRSLWKARERSW